MLRAIFLFYYRNVLYYKYVVRPRIILSVMAKRKRIRIETSPVQCIQTTNYKEERMQIVADEVQKLCMPSLY